MTEKSTVHLLIVTGQAQANLIPILQLRPDVVALAVSDSMQENAKDFIKLLKTIGSYQDKNIIQFDQVPDVGLEAIVDKAMEIEDGLQELYPQSLISYHATGGTKLMSLGFYTVFSNEKNRILYCDMTHGEIETLYPQKQSPIAIKSVLNINDALLSMGQTYRKSADEQWQEQANSRKELTKWLAQNAEELDQFFGCINGFVQKAIKQTSRGQLNEIEHPEHTFNFVPRKLWKEALKKLVKHNVVQWDESKPDYLYFHSLKGAEYIAGLWLEEFTWHIIKDLKPEEVKANVEFAESGALKSDIRNEMDCVVAHKNRLLLIECKTINFKKGGDKNTDILYKLESLGHRAAGLYGTKWLVSARLLDPNTLKRAQEYNIKVISGSELKDVKEQAKQWMDGKT